MFKKIFVIFFLINSSLFAYEAVKVTQISSYPEKYKNKDVLVYIKFDGANSIDGVFKDTRVDEIDYIYSKKNKALANKIKSLKQNDLVTVKGTVKVQSFLPVVDVDEIEKGWVDTTLLPATPSEITVTCPKCGTTFKYKLTKDDYKKAVLSSRNNDITPVTTKKDTRNDEEKENILRDLNISSNTTPSTTNKNNSSEWSF